MSAKARSHRPSAGAPPRAPQADALARLTAADPQLKSAAAQPFIRKAVDALRANDSQAGADWAIKALEQDERNAYGWCLLAVARERAGDFASSLKAYEAALALMPDNVDIAHDIGRLAMRMGMPEIAEKFFRSFLKARPDNVDGVNNLGAALRAQGRWAETVELMRQAIQAEPRVPAYWNSLAAAVAEQGDAANAEIFFTEALRLDPGFHKARYNLGNMKAVLGDLDGALACCEAALKGVDAEDERVMMQLSRATTLIGMGRLADGWEAYEARLHPQFADTLQFLTDAPRWTPGASLSGKSLLVFGEQGLGDEVLFANMLPDVLEALGPDGRLAIAVEPRLVPLFRRSFPQAKVGAHATGQAHGRSVRAAPFMEGEPPVDLWTPLASLCREFRRDVDAFPAKGGFLAADPARVAHWREVLKAAPAGRKVGLLWKSGSTQNARHRHFSPFDQWAPVLAQPGVAFVNLQYGDCAEELAHVRRELGVEIWTPPGIDLKQDLDDVAALCCAMDLVLGFSNATFNLAGACGAPAWLITTPGAWPRLGEADRYPWYPQARVFAPRTYGDWEGVMAEVAGALGAFGAEAER
jgi:Tfp pilus assembly protein PilF